MPSLPRSVLFVFRLFSTLVLKKKKNSAKHLIFNYIFFYIYFYFLKTFQNMLSAKLTGHSQYSVEFDN
jgi:hypothetical protein